MGTFGTGLGFGLGAAKQAAAATQQGSLRINGVNSLNNALRNAERVFDAGRFAAGNVQDIINDPIGGVAGRIGGPIGSILGRFGSRKGGLGQLNDTNGGRDVLQAARGREDPLMNFRWYCDMPNMPDGTQLGWEMIEECTLPVPEFDTVSNYRAGKNEHFVGKFNLPGLSVKMYEDSRGSSSNYCRAWRDAIFDVKTGTYQVPKTYKFPIAVTVLDVTNLTVMFYTYTGCWLTRTSAIQLSSASSDRIILDAEFQVDNVQITIGKFRQGAIPSIINNIGDNLGLLKYLPRSLPEAFSSVGNLFQ